MEHLFMLEFKSSVVRRSEVESLLPDRIQQVVKRARYQSARVIAHQLCTTGRLWPNTFTEVTYSSTVLNAASL
ncbi:hypothetical protein TNCV_3065341 [Trichonephila clavipes]|nr:hypothetical protein TNCV_3065341 [Trichonephila clavipes]